MAAAPEAAAAPANYRVDIKFTSAKDLLNVNSRLNRPLRPYFCAWVEDENRQCTFVADTARDRSYSWERQILYIPFNTLGEGTTLHVECFHQVAPGDHPHTERSVGYENIDLHSLSTTFGTIGMWHPFHFKLKRRSNDRPHGDVHMKFSIRKLGPEELTWDQEYDGVVEM